MVDAMNLRGMADIGYAATTVGAYDLYMGLDYFHALFDESGVPIVSANVYDESTGELIVEPYMIVERAGVKFGVVGVLDPSIDLRTHRDVETVGVTIGDPYAVLSELVPELRTKADVVILLSHTGLARAKDIAGEVAGIDFVVVGNHSAFSADPYEVSGAAFVQPGYKGQYMSDYRLSFNADGVYEGYTGKAVALIDTVPSDAVMALALKEHKLAVEGLSKDQAAARAREREAKAQARQAYVEVCVGVNDSCKRCHQPQYDQWMETAHADAYASLEEAHQSTNPACLRCHVTCHLDLPQDGTVGVPTLLRSVQCESCHGMGTDHARDGSYGTVTAATCSACHDKENSPEFDYATYAPRVAH